MKLGSFDIEGKRSSLVVVPNYAAIPQAITLFQKEELQIETLNKFNYLFDPLMVMQKMQILPLSLFLLFFLNANAQGVNQYGTPYDTAYLKNETKLIYSTTEKLRIIRIITPVLDTILRSGNLYNSLTWLGHVKADFEDCFVLYDDLDGFDEMQIYKKETGQLFLKGPVVTFDTVKQLMIYADWNKIDILYLYDLKSSKLEKYFTPSTNCLRYWYCIQVKAISETQFTIEYYAKNTNIKTKKTFTRSKTTP